VDSNREPSYIAKQSVGTSASDVTTPPGPRAGELAGQFVRALVALRGASVALQYWRPGSPGTLSDAKRRILAGRYDVLTSMHAVMPHWQMFGG
jgi:hypothetical protein